MLGHLNLTYTIRAIIFEGEKFGYYFRALIVLHVYRSRCGSCVHTKPLMSLIFVFPQKSENKKNLESSARTVCRSVFYRFLNGITHTHSWGQLRIVQPVPSPHPACPSNILHTVTWLCPHRHMHSHGSSGRGQHPHSHHTPLSELCPVVTVPYRPSHLYITDSQTQL